jgi:hypothetical protein
MSNDIVPNAKMSTRKIVEAVSCRTHILLTLLDSTCDQNGKLPNFKKSNFVRGFRQLGFRRNIVAPNSEDTLNTAKKTKKRKSVRKQTLCWNYKQTCPTRLINLKWTFKWTQWQCGKHLTYVIMSQNLSEPRVKIHTFRLQLSCTRYSESNLLHFLCLLDWESQVSS